MRKTVVLPLVLGLAAAGVAGVIVAGRTPAGHEPSKTSFLRRVVSRLVPGRDKPADHGSAETAGVAQDANLTPRASALAHLISKQARKPGWIEQAEKDHERKALILSRKDWEQRTGGKKAPRGGAGGIASGAPMLALSASPTPSAVQVSPLSEPGEAAAPGENSETGASGSLSSGKAAVFGFYPFAQLSNPFNQVAPDAAPLIFMETVILPTGADWESAIHLGGYYGDSLALVAVSEDGTVLWQLASDAGAGETAQYDQPYLQLNELDTDVYAASLCDSSGCSIPLFIAKPVNTAVPDSYPPAGNIHGEFTDDPDNPLLRIWGQAYDAIQKALARSGSGISEAYVTVDGKKYTLTKFDITLGVEPNELGVHDIQLWAGDAAHQDIFPVDADFVSQYRQKLEQVASADPSEWQSWNLFWQMYAYPWHGGFYSSANDGFWSVMPAASLNPVTASAEPGLDANNYLVLDGSSSVNANRYDWTLVNIGSGQQFTRSGATVGTEDLPPGLYEVTLKVPQYEATGGSPPYRITYSEDSFNIVIPPRFDLGAQQALGTVHSRWVSKQVADGSYAWALELAGNVFDELGAALHGYQPTDFEAWVDLNGQKIPVTLDENGHFAQSVDIGPAVNPAYDITLHVSTPNAAGGTADSTHHEYLYVFKLPSDSE
jgi:hypothetical protein